MELNSTTRIHQIYIKAEPAQIWDAITSPDLNGKYGYGGINHYELKPGGKFRCVSTEEMRAFGGPEVVADGEIFEVNPPYKLVQSYRFLITEETKKEGFTRITYEIEKTSGGFCRLTIAHDTADAPLMALVASNLNFSDNGGGGWDWVLSDLKTWLETGKRMTG